MATRTAQSLQNNNIVKFQGALTLENAKEIHAALKNHLDNFSFITIDLVDVDKVDLSFIQILIALLKNPDYTVSFTSMPDSLLDLATLVGADALIETITNKIEEST